MTRPDDAQRPRAAVLMPTYQGMEFLDRVLRALRAQETDFRWEMVVIDSSSSDGTWERLREAAADFPVPLRLERIHGVEFDHGDTRNLLAARTDAQILVFMTQDAIPSGPRWLATLVGNFDADARVGAAYCRNVPRPDARPLTKIFSEGDLGYQPGRREVRLPDAEVYAAMDPHERRALYNFNDVASAFRRDLWERHPFPRTPFGEDILMARAFLEAGYTVVYDDAATVEHSHDYDAEETRARTRVDGEFSAEWLGRICVAKPRDVDVLTERLSAEDAVKVRALGLPADEAAALERESRELRRATFEGLFEGGRTARRRPGTRMRDDARLRLLYVVHGFPPDTWAGTEIYTLNIAKEMQRRGHGVTVLTRAPAAGDEPDFSVREDEFEGLRVLRMTHRLEHANLRESFSKRGPEVVFQRLLGEVKPDVVHFQHLIHTSTGLVDLARASGAATVVTCHDYWGLCSRVQMIRPDGAICPSNMGSGCYLCVKERALGQVERVKALDAFGGGGVLKSIAALLGERGPEKVQSRARDYAQLRERERVVPAAYAAADLRISPSRFLRDVYLESGAFDPHSFLYSDNGMRTDHVEALRKEADPDGKVRFGFIGSVVWYKGVGVLVEAMRRLADAGLGDRVHLHVHGSFEPEKDAHHAEVQAAAAGAPVTFHGRFDNARLSEVYRDIDVLVVPSLWYENSPITIHEAFLTETPVLASAIGGMAEYVRDGVDGLHFDVGDAGDLAAKMRRLVEEPDLLARLRGADWMRVKTIEENGAETEARYRALACVVRETAAPAVEVPLFEPDVTRPTASEGAFEVQGGDRALLRPGASVSYELPGLSPGRYRVEVVVMHVDGEDGVALGGTLGQAGSAAERAVLEASLGSGAVVRSAELDLDGAADARLTVAADTPAGPCHLRFTRLSVHPVAPARNGAAAAEAGTAR